MSKKLNIGTDVTIKYCLVRAKTDTGKEDTVCIKCVQSLPTTRDELLMFLNYVWSYNYYDEIIAFKEISESEADSYDTSDDVFISRFFEVMATDDEISNTFCITGINVPSPEDALECINECRAECEKMKHVLWCKEVGLAYAVEHYQMNGWMWPYDVEMI